MGHMNIGTVDGAISVSPQVQQAVCCPKLDLGQAEHHKCDMSALVDCIFAFKALCRLRVLHKYKHVAHLTRTNVFILCMEVSLRTC